MGISGAGYDLVVVGSGAAGMTAAITAAGGGASVLLLEKEPRLGGTTAISAGSVWVPNSLHSPPGADRPEAARAYLDATVGSHAPEALKDAFLVRGPEMVAFLHENSEVRFRPYPYLPDYEPDMPGSTTNGRALETLPYDGRLLGPDLALVAPPLPEFTILGGMMVDRTDISHLMNATRSRASAAHAAAILARHLADRLRGHRGTRLVMGNALAARMLASLRRLGVEIALATPAGDLITEGGRVTGLGAGGEDIAARRGVILATGGFSHDRQLRPALLPEPVARYSAVPPGNEGDGIRLARAIGARMGRVHAGTAFWAPASVRCRADGSTAVFPHFALDRGKPGLIAVGRDGRRFVNEATSYHGFVQAMYRDPDRTIPAWLLCDARFLRRYGLGIARPGRRGHAALVREGYLTEGPDLATLAASIGVDAEGLAGEVRRAYRFAESGEDEDFGKGGNVHNRNTGDPDHGPNPCLGPIETPPFYALAVYPADIATTTGIETDIHARALGPEGEPISGLYMAGNDMQSVMGGVYAGPGATLGPAMTFGYVAARHATGAA